MKNRFLNVALGLGLLAAASAATADTGNVTLKTSLSNDNVLMPGHGTLHLAIDLSARDTRPVKRLPMNIAIVIDRSGSMEGAKIQDTREAARNLVKRLGEDDTLAIVSYSDDVRVDLPASKVTADVKKAALDAISRIRAAGSTNLSGGLSRGQEEVAKNLAVGQVNRVILMSDGIANKGITDTKAIAQQAQKESQRGVSVTTMGVGADYNEDLMTAVADHASGNYYFIKDAENISKILEGELQKMASTVAQAAQVEVALDDGVDLGQVFGYTFTQQDGKVVIPLAELFGGQKRSILLELKVPVVREGRTKVGSVKLTYVDVASESEKRETVSQLAVNVTKDSALVEKTRNRGVEERVEEVRVAQAITRAADLFKEGRGEEAQRVLSEQGKRTMDKAASMGGSAKLDAQAKDLKKLADEFKAAPPSAAPAAIKAAKEKSYQMTK